MPTKINNRNSPRKAPSVGRLSSGVVPEEPIDKIAEYLNFGTPEELERDDEEWRSIVANTTEEQLMTLEKKSVESAKRSPAVMLNFKGK